jgi:hypothetical protein
VGTTRSSLDHDSPRVNRAEWKCALRPTLPARVLASDDPLYREKMRKFFCAFETLPLSPRFDLENPAAMESYDTVVVGSDEVWNLAHPWYSGCQLFYGTGLRTERLVSYAASFGNYDAWWGLEEFWAGLLKNFDAIAVRDENSARLIVNALGLNPAVVLDPCLQFPHHARNHVDATRAVCRRVWPQLFAVVQRADAALGRLARLETGQHRLSQRLGR